MDLGWDKLNHVTAFAALAVCAVFGWRSSRAARLAGAAGVAGLRRRDRVAAAAGAQPLRRMDRPRGRRHRHRPGRAAGAVSGCAAARSTHEHQPSPSEEVIDPELPICDPHHHLWDRHGNRYLLDELLADTGQADAHGARHNVRSTVFVECASMYRADGPEPLRPVGETEFVNGIAAMSASGGYGDTRVAAGIVALRRPVPGRRGARGARGAHRRRRAGASAASAMPPAGMPASRSAIRTATRSSTCCATPPSARASRNWRRWG